MTNATAEATSRCVTGIPAYAVTPTPAVTPGTTWNGIPGGPQVLGLLGPPAEDVGVAPLQPDDGPPRAGVLDQQRVDRLLR